MPTYYIVGHFLFRTMKSEALCVGCNGLHLVFALWVPATRGSLGSYFMVMSKNPQSNPQTPSNSFPEKVQAFFELVLDSSPEAVAGTVINAMAAVAGDEYAGPQGNPDRTVRHLDNLRKLWELYRISREACPPDTALAPSKTPDIPEIKH